MKYLNVFKKIVQAGAGDMYFVNYPKPKLAAEREVAIAKARELGFTVDDSTHQRDAHWDGKSLSVVPVDGGWSGRNHPSNIIHEVAHWAVCTSIKRRGTPDYGLGSGPDSMMGFPEMMSRAAMQREEERASLLGVLMELELGFPACDSMMLHSWGHEWSKHDGNKPAVKGFGGTEYTYDQARGWTAALDWLVKKDLSDADGNVNWSQVSRGVADR